MKKFFKWCWTWFKNFWIGIWKTVKSMGNVRGALSLIISWLTLSGAGLFLLGLILAIPKLKYIGLTIYGIWLLPMTPLMMFTIGFALVIQRVVFRDKNVSWKKIINNFRPQKEQDKNDEPL